MCLLTQNVHYSFSTLTFKTREKTGPVYLYIISTKQTLCSRDSIRVSNPTEVKSGLQHEKTIYHEGSVDTLRRWIYDLISVLQLLKDITPHSCRAAATSKSKKLNINTEDILKQGCCKNMKTFKKHCEKETIYYADDDDVDFMKIIN